MHDEAAGKADSRIDLNRTGTPLLEIVSAARHALAGRGQGVSDELKLLLTYLGVSDCNMQEGSLRVDANVNLHIDTPTARVATPIVEIKNMNSFRAVERAMDYEAERQYASLARDAASKLGDVPKQTRGWDDVAERHPRPAAQGRIERLPLLPRSRPGAGHGHRRARSSRSARRSANCRPRCARGWKRPTASRPTTATCS